MATIDQLKAELEIALAVRATTEEATTKANKENLKAAQEVSRIKEAILEAESLFKVGDIVEDETGTRFRVTTLSGHGYGTPANKPMGIRLQKSGAEAHKDPRTIFSNKLMVVEIAG